MTGTEFLLLMIAPVGALLIAGITLYVTRHDRQKHNPAGE